PVAGRGVRGRPRWTVESPVPAAKRARPGRCPRLRCRAHLTRATTARACSPGASLSSTWLPMDTGLPYRQNPLRSKSTLETRLSRIAAPLNFDLELGRGPRHSARPLAVALLDAIASGQLH